MQKAGNNVTNKASQPKKQVNQNVNLDLLPFGLSLDKKRSLQQLDFINERIKKIVDKTNFESLTNSKIVLKFNCKNNYEFDIKK